MASQPSHGGQRHQLTRMTVLPWLVPTSVRMSQGRAQARAAQVRGALMVVTGLILGLAAVTVSLHTRTASAAVKVMDVGDLPALLGVAALAGPPGPPGPNPAAIRIPTIGVEGTLLRLGLERSGELQVPTDFAKAGWWSGGARPGDPGTAVIVGHLDSYTGSAVFYRLAELKPGQQVEILRADRSRAVFAVDARRTYSKAHFAVKAVYAPTATPSLRLITCGGAFDYRTRSYRDNLVVFAHLVRIVQVSKAKTPPPAKVRKMTRHPKARPPGRAR